MNHAAVLRDIVKVRREIPYLPLWFFLKAFGGVVWRRMLKSRGDRPLVVILPGFCESVKEFVLLALALQLRGYDVLLLDGLGWNIMPLSKMVRHGATLLRRLEREGVHVILIGHSNGALAAYNLAIRFPKAVKMVVLVAWPIAGSNLADLLAQLPLLARLDGVRNLTTTSRSLARLRKRPLPPCRIVILASPIDGPAPLEQCLIADTRRRKKGNEIEVHTIRVPHLGFFLSWRGISAIMDCLRQDLA